MTDMTAQMMGKEDVAGARISISIIVRIDPDVIGMTGTIPTKTCTTRDIVAKLVAADGMTLTRKMGTIMLTLRAAEGHPAAPWGAGIQVRPTAARERQESLQIP